MDGCQYSGVGEEAFRRNPVAEIVDFLCRECAFLGPKFELGVAEPLEDLSEAGEVLFPSGGKDDDIVEVEEAGFPVEPSQDSIHEAGEGSWSVAEAKRYGIKFKKLATACTEGSLLLILLLYGDLPVPAFQVKGREPASIMQSVEEVVDAGNGVSVLYGGRIELPKVDAESETTVLLFHHDY